jgi:hypothetical protein
MTPSEQLHLDASAYANKRIAMHKEAIKQQKQTPLDDKVHNGTWIAHYEGYVAGYEAQRPWVDLTDAEKDGKRVLENGLLFNAAEVQAWELGIDYAESKLKERNA